MQDRLRKLEEANASPEARRCVECGLPPDGLGYIVISDDAISDEGQRREQEWCAACGRPMYCIIEVVYEDDGERCPRPGEEEAVSWP
jgi:hypothetical protein